MRTLTILFVGGTIVASGLTVVADDRGRFVATLKSQNEVPAVSSPARGRFVAEVDQWNEAIEYTLTYTGLQAPVTQAHIHFAQKNVNGGIVAWLCGTTSNPGPQGTPQCPEEGSVTGTIRPENLVTQASQGIAAGEFDEFLKLLRQGLGYANVHTSQSPGGEIRGQIAARRSHSSLDEPVSDSHDAHE